MSESVCICEIIHIFHPFAFGFRHMFFYLFKLTYDPMQYREKYIYLH